LLVLLIIFMVATQKPPDGLDALVPQPDPNAKPSQEVVNRTVVISIDAQRVIRINTEQTDLRLLGTRLEDIFKTRNERVVFVKGDSSLPFADVAEIIDIAKGAGIDKIGLVLKELGEQ
ncbi:MAG TPA: biopolymer transporter ExbD, partial [Terriglobia bacterium]|nr:biopolymer transporter ExbD [Terriglobia bacterium]